MKKRFQKKENLRIILLAAALILGATLLLVGGMLVLTRVSSTEKKYDKDDFADVSMEKGNDKDDFSDQRPALTLSNEQPDDGFYTHLGYVFTYTVNPDGESCTVTGMIKPEVTGNIRLRIPEKCDGYTVTAIGDGAFQNSQFIYAAVITTTLDKIGDRAFYNCKRLIGVYSFRKEIGTIGASAFEECDQLSVFSMVPKFIEEKAFMNCTSLAAFDFSMIDELGENAFKDAGLESLIIGQVVPSWREGPQSHITEIPRAVFQGCPLRYILVGGQIKTVGSNNFRLCDDRAGACPQVMIFMEGVETVEALEQESTGVDPGAFLFLPISIKTFGIQHAPWGDFGQEVSLFYAGSKEQCKEIDFVNVSDYADKVDAYYDVDYSKFGFLGNFRHPDYS